MQAEATEPTVADHAPLAKVKRGGVRERSKRERQDRIMLAARKLFAERGYDGTTLRLVAEHAGLGLGTLFNYISDKRDLIYLVFNRDVSGVTDAALAAPRAWQSFSEKILSMTEHNYRLFGSEPVLSRILLSEVLQHTPGLHLAEYFSIRDRFIRGMEEVVREAQAAGEVGSRANPAEIARQIFFLHSAALRWWLAATEVPDWRVGMREFTDILAMLSAGLDLHPEANRSTVARVAKTNGSRARANA